MIKLERYDSKAWAVSISYIVPATFERGKNAGKPNPDAGTVAWLPPKYPGNYKALVNWLLDYAVRNQTDATDLQTYFENLQATIAKAEASIIAQLKTNDNQTILLDL